MENDIIACYTETYSVTKVIEKTGIGRKRIVRILKEAGVYEGLNGPNYLAKKQENLKQTMLEKYGVENISQLNCDSLKERNSIAYKNIGFDLEFSDYKKRVANYTKNLVTRKKSIVLPEKCFYTGYRFRDCDSEKVNPNDPFKRTVDHKYPILLCFIDGWPIEEAGGPDNIIFVLRYVNSVKSNTTHESFLPIAEKIKKMLDAEYAQF